LIFRFSVRNLLRWVLLLLIIAIISIQFYRPNKNDAKVTPSTDFFLSFDAPESVKKHVVNACYDCHSNTTKYTWFDNVMPIGWWVDNTILKGKTSLNFSVWEQYEGWHKLNLLSAIEFDLKTSKMPPKNYTEYHKSAELSNDQRQEIIDWISTIDRPSLVISKTNNYNYAQD